MPITVNGFSCKRNFTFTPEDFASMGIAQPGEPNIFGTRVAVANVFNMPGLNTLGMSWSRVDFDPDGLNPPHTHPRATEIIFVLEGQLRAEFITTDNVFVNKLITKGEVFVFPRGLIHFSFNVGRGNATIIVAFNSQNPGVQVIALSMFASRPQIPDDVVARAFQTSVEEVRAIRARLVPTNVTMEHNQVRPALIRELNVKGVTLSMGQDEFLSQFSSALISRRMDLDRNGNTISMAIVAQTEEMTITTTTQVVIDTTSPLYTYPSDNSGSTLHTHDESFAIHGTCICSTDTRGKAERVQAKKSANC
uniref:Nectarin-1 n=1 Tax=Nicotiana sylvestris TaxID=4096 RepID=A0A1U7UY01_NICSY|nr:PREDICTED: nectarin-1-like [Nicotiana sylvestris]